MKTRRTLRARRREIDEMAAVTSAGAATAFCIPAAMIEYCSRTAAPEARAAAAGGGSAAAAAYRSSYTAASTIITLFSLVSERLLWSAEGRRRYPRI